MLLQILQTGDKDDGQRQQSGSEPSGTSSQELNWEGYSKSFEPTFTGCLAASVTETWTTLLYFLLGCIIAVIEKQRQQTPLESSPAKNRNANNESWVII